MGIPIRELRSRITAAEFVKYMGFSLLEPFDDARADDRARGIMAMVLAAGGAKNIEPHKFLPVWQPPKDTAAGDMAAFLARLDRMADYSGDPPIS